MFLHTPATTDAAQAIGGKTNAEAMKAMCIDN
jgi:biopolymer transport protein ExbB